MFFGVDSPFFIYVGGIGVIWSLLKTLLTIAKKSLHIFFKLLVYEFSGEYVSYPTYMVRCLIIYGPISFVCHILLLLLTYRMFTRF